MSLNGSEVLLAGSQIIMWFPKGCHWLYSEMLLRQTLLDLRNLWQKMLK